MGATLPGLRVAPDDARRARRGWPPAVGRVLGLALPGTPLRFAEFDVAFARFSDIKLCKTFEGGSGVSDVGNQTERIVV